MNGFDDFDLQEQVEEKKDYLDGLTLDEFLEQWEKEGWK